MPDDPIVPDDPPEAQLPAERDPRPQQHGGSRPIEREPQPGPQYEQVWIERHEQIEASAFPSPDIVRGLERALPGAGDRAFRMAEQEQAHRRRLETRAQDAYIKGLHRGQFFTVFLAFAWLLISLVLILKEQSLIGIGFFLADIVFITLSVVRAQPKFDPEPGDGSPGKSVDRVDDGERQ